MKIMCLIVDPSRYTAVQRNCQAHDLQVIPEGLIGALGIPTVSKKEILGASRDSKTGMMRVVP